MKANVNYDEFFGNQEIDEIDDLISLTDENGEEENFHLLDVVEYGGKEYAVLLPETDEEGMVVILEVITEDGENGEFVAVEDDSILETVFEIFRVRNEENFNFEG